MSTFTLAVLPFDQCGQIVIRRYKSKHDYDSIELFDSGSIEQIVLQGIKEILRYQPTKILMDEKQFLSIHLWIPSLKSMIQCFAPIDYPKRLRDTFLDASQISHQISPQNCFLMNFILHTKNHKKRKRRHVHRIHVD